MIGGVWVGSFEEKYVEGRGLVPLCHIKVGSYLSMTIEPDPVLTDPKTIYTYYHSDHLGSSSVMTDEAGNRCQHYGYSPFGREVHLEDSTSLPLSAFTLTGFNVSNRFTGQILDEETELYYYGARYYDPFLARFVQADSIIPNPGSSQALNRYSYCYNNPLKFTDPSGHWPLWIDTSVAYVTGFAIGLGEGLRDAKQGIVDTIAEGANMVHDSYYLATSNNIEASALRSVTISDSYAVYSESRREGYSYWDSTYTGFGYALSVKVGIADIHDAYHGYSIHEFRGSLQIQKLDNAGRISKAFEGTLKMTATVGGVTSGVRSLWPTDSSDIISLRNIPKTPEIPRLHIPETTKLHKNNDKYVGPQAVYEIKIDGGLYKYGKADMTNMASSGLPRRLDSQLKRLENTFPGSEVEGNVLFQNPSISTKGIKSIETQYIQRYYDLFGELPPANPKHPGININK